MTAPALPNEVFLSFSANNGRFASKLTGVLRSHGVPVWYSNTNIGGAQDWSDQITEALERCDWFAVVLSPQAEQSRWLKREVIYALGMDRYADRIIPVLYRPCNLSKITFALKTIQHVDFRANHKQGFRDLLGIWGLGYNGK